MVKMLRRPGPDIDTNGQPSHSGNTCQDILTGLSGLSSKYTHTRLTSLSIQASQCRRPCRYSQPIQSSKPYLSRVTFRGGVTLTLTSNKFTPPSQANHSSRPSLPSRNFHTSQSRQNCHSAHHSQTIKSNIQERQSIRMAILVTLVITVRLSRLVSLGGLVSIDILDLLVCLANLVSLGIHVIIVSRSNPVSLICLWLGLGEA